MRKQGFFVYRLYLDAYTTTYKDIGDICGILQTTVKTIEVERLQETDAF